MANKGVALLVVICLVLIVAAVPAVKATEDVYKGCNNFCIKVYAPIKKSHSLSEKFCDDECVAVENLAKLGVKFDFEKGTINGVAGVEVDTSEGVLKGFRLLKPNHK